MKTEFFCGNFAVSSIWATGILTLAYGVMGAWDDALKVIQSHSRGLSPRGKLLWQFTWAIGVLSFMKYFGGMSSELYIPFLKGPLLDLGWVYVFFGSLVIVGSSNAVNLTDGLDGLAIGPVITSTTTLALLAYASGHYGLAEYLYIPFVEGAGELMVFGAATLGASLGFLWYNAYPAQIFMGDVGSLSLGGFLGTLAVLTKNEFLFVLIGGVFVLETLSVILQVASFKLRKKRIFRMAPIHHHFELAGGPEPKIIVRFWIVSILLAVMALATLKVR